MFLEDIRKIKREEVNRRKSQISLSNMEEKISALPLPRDLIGSISQKAPMAVVAEIKQASPSAGAIRMDADRLWLASQYEVGGACAISVLTEAHFFHGDLDHLRQVKKRTSLPVLLKDFVIDPFQIYEGRAAGADAILLIAALLDREQLKSYGDLSRNLGMVPLVEVHDEEDLKKVFPLDLSLIGVNNRNLKNLQVDLGTTFRLIKRIPPGMMVISESGINKREDVRRLQEAGVRGILVGEVLMRAPYPASKIKELLDLYS